MLEGTSGLWSDDLFTPSPRQSGNNSSMASMVQKQEPAVCCPLWKLPVYAQWEVFC